MKTVIVTGANSGIGYECVRAIAVSEQNWTIVMACRDLTKSEVARQKLIQETGIKAIVLMELNLGSLLSIRAFVNKFLAADLPPLHGLINNAGLQVFDGIEYTKDGFEVTFGTNHLGHFLLTNLLLPHFKTPGRIIVVSSGTHDPDTIDGKFNKPVFLGAKHLAYPKLQTEMSGLQRYSTSKLCNLLFAYELSRKLQGKGITVNSFDPGAVPATNLLNSIKSPIMRTLIRRLSSMFVLFGVKLSTPQRSGAALARLLLDPSLSATSGVYFQITNAKQSSKDSYNTDYARGLWADSAHLVGLTNNLT